MYWDNFGTIANTTVNINGSSMNYHFNSMNPCFSCSSFWGFSPGCFGFGFSSPYSYNFGCSPKAAFASGLGFAAGMALPSMINGLVGLFKKS